MRRVSSPGKAKQLPFCKRKGCPLEEVGVKLHRRASDVGRACKPGMANKENEMTCSDDVRGIHYNDNRGFPINSPEVSKMAGARAKYNDLNEVCQIEPLILVITDSSVYKMIMVSICVAVKGPRSNESRIIWKESSTKSGTNLVEKKCQ